MSRNSLPWINYVLTLLVPLESTKPPNVNNMSNANEPKVLARTKFLHAAAIKRNNAEAIWLTSISSRYCLSNLQHAQKTMHQGLVCMTNMWVMMFFTHLPFYTWIKSNHIVGSEHPKCYFYNCYRDLENPCWKSIRPCRVEEEVPMLIKYRKLYDGHGKLWHPIKHNHDHGKEQSASINSSIIYWIMGHLGS